MVKKKKKEITCEEMAVEVSDLVDKGEATFDVLKKISEKYRLDEKQEKVLERRYLEIRFETRV